MSSYAFSAVVAVLLGLLVGLLLFVPLVAVSYRRRGRLTLGRFLLWAAALVSFLAIWTYTLLPLPRTGDYACSPVVLSLAPTVEDLIGAFADGHPLTDMRLLQVAFNVLLFVPLGFLLRVLGGRGVLVALLVGAAVSLTIELTQLTGAWGVFPCAYRMFDIGDLVTNTSGAVAGSLLALFVPAHLRGTAPSADAGRPRPVTRGRRLLAVVCDLLGIGILSGGSGVAVQVWLQYIVRDREAVLDAALANAVSTWVPIVVWFVVIMVTGRSLGDLCVELRYAGGRMPEPAARGLRFLGGVGGYLLILALPGALSLPAGLWGLAAAVLLFTTKAGRGLPGVLTGRVLRDARATRRPVGPAAPQPSGSVEE